MKSGNPFSLLIVSASDLVGLAVLDGADVDVEIKANPDVMGTANWFMLEASLIL